MRAPAASVLVSPGSGVVCRFWSGHHCNSKVGDTQMECLDCGAVFDLVNRAIVKGPDVCDGGMGPSTGQLLTWFPHVLEDSASGSHCVQCPATYDVFGVLQSGPAVCDQRWGVAANPPTTAAPASCECGAAACGVSPGGVGHSSWCPQAETR